MQFPKLKLKKRKPSQALKRDRDDRAVLANFAVNKTPMFSSSPNASVQVMLFKDRLEVWNPGTLPPTLTLEKLPGPHVSAPHNPLLAEPEIRIDGGFFVLTVRRKTSEPGAKPAQVTGQVDPWLIRALTACALRPLSSREIQESTGLRHRETFQRNYLDQIINDGLIERTIPEKPTSRLQKYRLTEKGRGLLERLEKEGGRL